MLNAQHTQRKFAVVTGASTGIGLDADMAAPGTAKGPN